MKTLNFVCLLAILLLTSCSSDNDNLLEPINETQDLILVKSIESNTHKIDIYSKSGYFEQGYNKIYFQLKDVNENYINNASVTWKPMMHMMEMNHSCPYSAITRKAESETLYEGYIVFQMPSNGMEFWTITFEYSINGENFTAEETVEVLMAPKKRINVFTGSDDVRYILALIEPANPQVAINDMTVGIFKMENMMSFPIVNNFKMNIDPRMPSMGNHSSPNNVNLTQSTLDNLYHGKLSLTMTGYWKINLQLLNALDEVIKGEEVTDSNPESSIFFELEF